MIRHMVRRLRGIQARRRLVQEDDARISHQRHREVEPAPHAAGVGGGRLAGGLNQIEAPQQPARAPPPFSSPQVTQVGHQHQVLLACEEVVHRRKLSRNSDRSPDSIGISGHVMAGDPDLTPIGGD